MAPKQSPSIHSSLFFLKSDSLWSQASVKMFQTN